MKAWWYWLLIYVLNVPKDEVKDYSDILLGAIGLLMFIAGMYVLWHILG
jgi:hypothetical protein